MWFVMVESMWQRFLCNIYWQYPVKNLAHRPDAVHYKPPPPHTHTHYDPCPSPSCGKNSMDHDQLFSKVAECTEFKKFNSFLAIGKVAACGLLPRSGPTESQYTGPRSTVGNVCGNRCESDCRSKGRVFDPARSHTFVEIEYEIISTVILLHSAELFKKGCCQLQAKVCERSTG